MKNPIQVLVSDMVAFHRWLQEIPNPEKIKFDPDCGICQRQRNGTAKAFDFHPDWSGEVARAWLIKTYRRFKRG